MKYLFLWPVANIRSRPRLSLGLVTGIAGATFVIASLLGFVTGYQTAVTRDVDRMGFDLLITARGCPYEAATLMLRGGAGLRYMPDTVVQRLQSEPSVQAVYPTLIHPLRDPSSDSGMLLLKGVEPGSFSSGGFTLKEGRWLGDMQGVVLGYEAAELEGRRAGDSYLLPGPNGGLEVPVLGILERSGSQIDGTILMDLGRLQEVFGLQGRLTGVGLQLHPSQRDQLGALQDRYNAEAELQAVSLSGVMQALRLAMTNLKGLVRLVTALLALMGAGLVLNTTLLKTLVERKRMFVLGAIGFPARFVVSAALIENLLLLCAGLIGGLLATLGFGEVVAAYLVRHLPYVPPGDLVQMSPVLALRLLGAGLALGVAATLPPLMSLTNYSAAEALQDD